MPLAVEQRIQQSSLDYGNETQVLVTEYVMHSGFIYEIITEQSGEKSMRQCPPLPGTRAWWALHGGAQEEDANVDVESGEDGGGIIELA